MTAVTRDRGGCARARASVFSAGVFRQTMYHEIWVADSRGQRWVEGASSEDKKGSDKSWARKERRRATKELRDEDTTEKRVLLAKPENRLFVEISYVCKTKKKRKKKQCSSSRCQRGKLKQKSNTSLVRYAAALKFPFGGGGGVRTWSSFKRSLSTWRSTGKQNKRLNSARFYSAAQPK